MSNKRAIFLDRDGTLVEPRHYPSSPDELQLYPAIATELRQLQEAGFQLVVITNQSGIARGYFTESDLHRMHDHLARRLADEGVQIAGFYHCPHHVDGVVPELTRRCDCRKPQPGLLLQAAAEHGLDTERSWMVGDILDDVEAGNRAGCRTILVDLETENAPQTISRRPDFIAKSTDHALQIIRSQEGLGPAVDTAYQPKCWGAFESTGSASTADVSIGQDQ